LFLSESYTTSRPQQSFPTRRSSDLAAVLEAKLLKDGGFATTEYNTGEQWDAPNGWAPLEWMMIWGLDRCGQKNLAAKAAKRWIRSEEHTSELQSLRHLVCRLLLEKK